MGLVISTQGIIRSDKPRKVVSQIKGDVLALLDARYLESGFSIGQAVDKITVHGNEKSDYRYLRKSTNVNNPNAPILKDSSLLFDGNASLRTNAFATIEKEFTCAMVVKLQPESCGVFLRIGSATDTSSSQNLLYSATTDAFLFRNLTTTLVSIPANPSLLSDYFTVIISCSKTETKMLINGTLNKGAAAGLLLEYYQLMSGDHSIDKVKGNLKYFSLYDNSATDDEMYKLQQILQQNFDL